MRVLAVLLALTAASPALALDYTVGGRIEQGGIVIGRAPPGAVITFNNLPVDATADGRFLLGLDRDAPATATLTIAANGETVQHILLVAPRAWQIEKVDGVPQQLVTPDPKTAARIAADNKRMAAARAQVELQPWFDTGFIRPAEGRVSGVFGSQRILNGSPRAPHTGLDIAGPIGTPIRAAADGVVALASPDMVLTGQTVVINHGYGLQTTYIHMSRIDVKDGQKVKQGDVIGAIGMTGRATGPHLHFGVTWFNTRLDPETVLAAMPPKAGN